MTSSGTVQGASKPDSGGNEEQQVVGSSHVQQTGCSGTVQGGSDIGQVVQQAVSSSVHSSVVSGVNVDKQVLDGSVSYDTVSRQLEDE